MPFSVDPEQPLGDHQVAVARDRQELGEALDQPEQRRLGVGHARPADARTGSGPGDRGGGRRLRLGRAHAAADPLAQRSRSAM